MSRLALVESDEAALLKQGRATSKVLYPGPDGSSTYRVVSGRGSSPSQPRSGRQGLASPHGSLAGGAAGLASRPRKHFNGSLVHLSTLMTLGTSWSASAMELHFYAQQGYPTSDAMMQEEPALQANTTVREHLPEHTAEPNSGPGWLGLWQADIKEIDEAVEVTCQTTVMSPQQPWQGP